MEGAAPLLGETLWLGSEQGGVMPNLNVVEFPDTFSDSEKQLRRLADEVAEGEFGGDPHIVCVISGPDGIQVRGLGTVDGMIAIATLNLGLAWLVNNTLEGMEE